MAIPANNGERLEILMAFLPKFAGYANNRQSITAGNKQ
jgi:hypothetical protein